MTERITFSSFYYASRKGGSLTFGAQKWRRTFHLQKYWRIYPL